MSYLLNYDSDTGGCGPGLVLFPTFAAASAAFGTDMDNNAGYAIDSDRMRFRKGVRDSDSSLDFRWAGGRSAIEFSVVERVRRFFRRLTGRFVLPSHTHDIYKLAGHQYRWIWVVDGVDDFSREYILTRLRDPYGRAVFLNGCVPFKLTEVS